MFALGDVSGKGMNAALLMAKTASLYRCLGKTIDHPGKLMARVNAEICETAARGMFVTMLGGIYNPATGRLRVANAGHEPPLVIGADGTIRAIEADAPPLGISTMVVPETGYPVETIELAGGAFYVFTDGLTEGYTAPGEELGSEAVQTMLTGGVDQTLADRLEAVIAVVRDSGEQLRDDLTMLGIDDAEPKSVREDGAKDAEDGRRHLARVEVPSNPDRLRLVRDMIGDCCRLASCDDRMKADLVLAVDEACQNVIRHAYQGRTDGRMEISVWLREDGEQRVLEIEIHDDADPIDPSKVKPRDLDDVRPGGLGTHIIQEIMDTVDFVASPDESGNILRLTKRL